MQYQHILTHACTYMPILAYTVTYLQYICTHMQWTNLRKNMKQWVGPPHLWKNALEHTYWHIHAHTVWYTCTYLQDILIPAMHTDTCTYMHIHARSIIHADTSKYMHIQAHTCNTPTHQTWNGHISATNQPIATSQRTERITVSTRQIVLVCGTIDSFPRIWRHLKNWSRGSSLAHQNPENKQPISACADASCTMH